MRRVTEVELELVFAHREAVQFNPNIGQFRKSIVMTKSVTRRKRPTCRMDDWPFTTLS